MKLWIRIFSLATLLSIVRLHPEDELKEFDDDAFLSSNVAPDEATGLIGWSLFSSSDGEDRYIINFNNVSVVEYLRFVSRISGLNFQFEEAQLDFTITLMSDEPLTVADIVSSLIQTLRARGFSVLEENRNLFITTSLEVNQIPAIVGPGHDKDAEKSPIVTRVFRIKNANPNSLASIIKPMLSARAMVDISNETRQLLVTDITTNVNKVATLLQTLDSPHSPFEIDMYRAKHISADVLILMAKQILEPFADPTALTFVPQLDTNTIFIVSTPSLIERAMEVIEDLDASPKQINAGLATMGSQVFLYLPTNKTADELLLTLHEIANELDHSGSQSVKLVIALKNAKWVKDSNSLLFITDEETKVKIEAILKTVDTVSDTKNYYIYKVDKAGKEQIEQSLEQLAKTLRKNPLDRELVDAIQSMRFIKETNAFIFTGADAALKKLQELLPTFDVAVAQYSPSSHFWLYTPQYLSGKELEKALEDLEDNLSDSGLSDEALLSSIESMKWIPTTNTLLFTGTPSALEQIESMIKLIDVPSGSPNKIFLYRPQYISNNQIEEALDELADRLDHKNLSDKNLAKAIDTMAWITDSQTFLFKADPGTIEKIEGFLKDIDNPKEAEAIAQSYYLYTLQFASGNDVIDHLEKIAKSLPEKDPSQKAIADVIDDATFLRDANAILLTGPQKAVEDVKLLIGQFDVKGATPIHYEKTSFFIYKPTHMTLTALQEALRETAQDLKKSGLADPTLLQSIETMQAVELTNSLLFTGTKESLDKTKEIIDTIDVAGAADDALGEFAGHTFFIYKVRYLPIQELMGLLANVTKNLEKETADASNKMLIKTIRTAKEIKESNSILFTGPPAILEKVADLLKQLDAPGGLGEEVREAGSYVVYKPVNVSGPELIDMMKDFEENLRQSGVREQGLFETIDNLKYIERTSYILISGPQSAVDKTQELLRKFDIKGTGGVTSVSGLETSFLVYKLQYHSGQEIQTSLKQIGQDLANSSSASQNLISAINSIQWIKMTNSMLATGTPDVLTQLKELIQNVDVPLRQVFIEVLIIRTTITNNQQFGLQWGGKSQYLNKFAAGVSNFPSPGSFQGSANTALAPALQAVNATRTPLATDIPNPRTQSSQTALPGGFDLGVIGDIILHKGKSFISLASLVNALQSDSDSVIVMNPKIIAQDNQQATIFVGQNIPFTGSNVTTVGGGASSQVQSNVEYRDVGTNLTITPILGGGDIVTLDISNQISEQVATTTATTAELAGLQTTQTTLNARVHVPNKHFVALSGMISDTKTHFRSSIPCLGGLPVIGAIFSENDRLNARDNLIFFLRPVIIDTIEQYDQITENQEELYKEQGVKQIIKEEIDDGINWIRDMDLDAPSFSPKRRDCR